MGVPGRTLYEEVFAVFERACQESDFELAEDLLLALEAMDRRQEAHRQLDRAYLLLPASEYVSKFLATFEEYPPRQQPGSFTIGDAKEKILTAVGSK